MSFYLAVDLGTTGCRSIIFDSKLKQIAWAYEEYGLITPKEKWVEQDAELWWQLTKSTAKSAIAKAGIPGSEIKGISISSQGITLVPVDKNIKPLCNAISWLDSRAEAETEEIGRDFGEEKIFFLTGKPLLTAYTLPKLIWLMRNCKEIYESAYKILMPLDFLTAKFTGECVTDYSMASGTLMYDLKGKCWAGEILDRYGIDEEKLPRIAEGGECVGKVRTEVARELGLSADCTVSLGAQDQKCAAHGAGLCDGVMTVSLGTAVAVTKLWREAKTEINNGVGWCGYTERDAYVTEGVINTAGTCLRYVRDLMFANEKYDVIDKEAEQARKRGSSLIFHPYLSGPSAPDFYDGSIGNFYGVNLATERGDYALAVMEGIAFGIRRLLEAMEAYGNVHTLVLFGGGAKSELWCQIISDVTGMEIKVPSTTEAAGAGAALLAGKGIGDKISPLSYDSTYVPSMLVGAYEEKYNKYREIEKKLWEIKK